MRTSSTHAGSSPRRGEARPAGTEFEQRTGGAWPINVGQIYTTLARLERDGLVQADGSDDEGRITYHLTGLGADVVRDWWLDPVSRDESPRDELVIKVAMALSLPEADATAVVTAQRTASMRRLQALTRSKLSAPGDAGTDLTLEYQLYTIEAEIRWLDHVESVLVRRTPTKNPSHPRGEQR